MTATISRLNKEFFTVNCTNPKFVEEWGKIVTTSNSCLFSFMSELTEWANNTAQEEMLFEVD